MHTHRSHSTCARTHRSHSTCAHTHRSHSTCARTHRSHSTCAHTHRPHSTCAHTQVAQHLRAHTGRTALARTHTGRTAQQRIGEREEGGGGGSIPLPEKRDPVDGESQTGTWRKGVKSASAGCSSSTRATSSHETPSWLKRSEASWRPSGVASCEQSSHRSPHA